MRFETAARDAKGLHLFLAGVWVLLLLPSLLWWSESILWVITISLYANFVGHLSAAQAAQAEGVDGHTREQLDWIVQKLKQLELELEESDGD